MRKYRSTFRNLKEQVSIEELLTELKDLKLSNESSRKDFVRIITHVALSNEMVARSFMKKVGEALRPVIAEIGNETSSLKPDGGDVQYRQSSIINMDTGTKGVS